MSLVTKMNIVETVGILLNWNNNGVFPKWNRNSANLGNLINH